MKILSAQQIKKVDELTIVNEPVSSIDLMERAARACLKYLLKKFSHTDKLYIVCGKGNNGGDGLALARLWAERGNSVKVLVIHYAEKFSEDAQRNYDHLKSRFPNKIEDIHSLEELKENLDEPSPIIIDAIFGSGLNKPVEGLTAEVINHLNGIAGKIISIDMPSGLFADQSSIKNKSIIKASVVLSFQLPKLAFFMPENVSYVREFKVLDIGLDEKAIEEQKSDFYYIKKKDISPLLKTRRKFDHKGTFGHALLLAGSKGKAGAAIIAANACLRSGAGLLTVHSVDTVIAALMNILPEAMSSMDAHSEFISTLPPLNKPNAIAYGPGVGMSEGSGIVLKNLIQNFQGKLLIDADGLNILSENKTWLSFLVPSTILTPHIKEFERLAGTCENDFERLIKLKEFSVKHSCIVILKGGYTAIGMPDGTIIFNSTGNPGLAKGGSGDGLTGIILGLLARGYNAPQSALIGTFIHGYSADMCAKNVSEESLLISDVIEMLPKAFKKLETK